MKRFLSIALALVSAVIIGVLQVSAENGVPMTGDENWWIWLVLAVIAVVMVVVLVITGKKK